MPESSQHSELVSRIVQEIRREHGTNPGLSILVDSGPVLPGRKPSRIGSYCPDVEARTVPASFVILGEAKSFADAVSPHTVKQLAAYLDFLALQQQPSLIMAVPLAALGSARSIVRRVQLRTNSQHVPTRFLFG